MLYTLENKSMQIALYIALFLYIVLNLTVIYYYFVFRRREFIQQYVNQKLLLGLFAGLLSPIVFIITGFVIGYNQVDQDKLVIAMITSTFAFLILSGLLIYFGLQYLAIGIDNKEISFLGEKINISNITEIEKNTKTKRIVIKYNVGSRGKKKWRFFLKSQAGKFILDNINLLDQQLVEI